MFEPAGSNLPRLATEVLTHGPMHAVPDEVSAVLVVVDVQPLRALNGHAVELNRARSPVDRIEEGLLTLTIALGCTVGHGERHSREPNAHPIEIGTELMAQQLERPASSKLETGGAGVGVWQLRASQRRTDGSAPVPTGRRCGGLDPRPLLSTKHAPSLRGVGGCLQWR